MASGAQHRGLAAAHEPSDEPLSWYEAGRRRRTRSRVISAILVAVVIVAVISALTVNAADHYRRGHEAMAAKRYGAAAEEFAAARVLTVWYGNAQALGREAQRALELDAARTDLQRQERAAVSRLLVTARDRLAAGDVSGTLAAVHSARVLVPAGSIARTSGQRKLRDGLTTSFQKRGAEAIAAGRWNEAAQLATVWLVLTPESQAALTLQTRAAKARKLQQDLVAAQDAAKRGRWRDALRLAQGVERSWPRFPGAAALVARAQAALAPKPKPKATATATRAPAPVATSAPQSAPAPPPP